MDQSNIMKKDGNGYGIASLVLGIISLLLFCACINWITAILAIVFGVVQLAQYKEKGLAIGGIITAGLSILFAIILYVCIFLGIAAEGYDDVYDYYEYYEESVDYEFLNGMRI